MAHEERNFLIHPMYIIMFLTLAGITALFLGFSAAYLYNRIQQGIPPVKLPALFYWNSLLLVGSSYTLWQSKKAYQADETETYKKLLMTTMVLTVLFLIAQMLAWYQMITQEILINHSTMASYMYLISGLHFAHVIAGIPFLGYFIWVAYKRIKEPISVLMYFSDPAKKRKLDLLNWYWHFLDGLWIYLVLFFLANYLI